MKDKISLSGYLQKISAMVDDPYGRQIRTQFADHRGSSELAMLQSPTGDELEQLKKAVAIMTPQEKKNAHNLTDQQVQKIAEDAEIDPAIMAIFINGYTIKCKRVS